jgi:hypothetical protein
MKVKYAEIAGTERQKEIAVSVLTLALEVRSHVTGLRVRDG